MPEQITLYGNDSSPFSHRVTISLKEVGAQYTMCPIEATNKPAWFTEKIPCISYGGPATDPAAPSPESRTIPESLVIAELLADLHPAAALVPADPLAKADMRLFAHLPPAAGFAAGAFSLADVAVAPFLLRGEVLMRYEIRKYPVGEGRRVLDALAEPRFARLAKYSLGGEFERLNAFRLRASRRGRKTLMSSATSTEGQRRA
ncbi:uncharacterized protein BXZ73DRAFT_90980 [Epithele typhae]|uniref:uncharacterized protein n=1 Tax=Epithele typhae TaxID=378194 RepID=UPI0020084963|nr:uncharacterized protein BXZ73DRAFT_90980 [Epithele typhae]KAH9926322.1 hypothetical protein BXZ73DRAFT_90980 [Epithele typhae]